MLKSYLKKLFKVDRRGDAREESYYSCLEELLKNYSESINRKNVQVTILPKKTDAGNPDFRIWDGEQQIVWSRRILVSIRNLFPIYPSSYGTHGQFPRC